jgi:hypothetical protein
VQRAPPLEFRRAEAMDVVHEWALLWRGRAARPGAPHPDFEEQRAKIVPCMVDLMQRAAYMECLEQMAQVGALHCLEQAGRMYEAEGRGAVALSCFRRAARDAREYRRAEFVALFDALCARHGALRGHRAAPAAAAPSERSSAMEEEAKEAAADAGAHDDDDAAEEAARAEHAEEEEDDEGGEFSFMYRYIPRESCSQFDSLPLTSFLDRRRGRR